MKKNKVWLISVEMGYGHHRAAYALESISNSGVLNADKDDFVSPKEKKQWKRILSLYNFASRVKSIAVIGKFLYGFMDRLLHIPSYYPLRDLSEKTFQVNMLISNINKGLCTGVLNEIKKEQLPIVTTIYAPAIAADLKGFDEIYCVITDSDINRVWAAPEPWDSRIKYFVPCGKAGRRLEAYGVSKDKIFNTGFPIPESLIGDREMTVLKRDLGTRLNILDPEKRFFGLHKVQVEHFLGNISVEKNERPLTITYAVGGAGAQKEIGGRIVKSLKKKIHEGEVRINLVAGIREEVNEYFLEIKNRYDKNGDIINICYSPDMKEYFNLFNELIHTTDILWTKPSELSFYSGLGIPLIMSPVIGAQEKFNRKWLREIGAGIKQMNPDYTDQWLFDWIETGRLAEAAWFGFLKARKLGVYKIKEVLETGNMEDHTSPLRR